MVFQDLDGSRNFCIRTALHAYACPLTLLHAGNAFDLLRGYLRKIMRPRFFKSVLGSRRSC